MNNILRNISAYLICIMAALIIGCDTSLIGERESAPYKLQIKVRYAESERINNGTDEVQLRHIVRFYPAQSTPYSTECIKEMVFTGNGATACDSLITADIVPGDYKMLVWADIIQSGKAMYDASNFAEISLAGEPRGNNDCHKTFRGEANISLNDTLLYDAVIPVDIVMKPTQAKYEIIANDLSDFIEKEMKRLQASEANDKEFDISNYTAVCYYVGFVPDTYSMFTDKPVDSATGVMFKSTLKPLNDNEAAIGFDYVFVGNKESAATVRIGIYDANDKLVSLTSAMKISLNRDRKTILHGKYLTSKSSEGINIDPNYDGNFNWFVP